MHGKAVFYTTYDITYRSLTIGKSNSDDWTDSWQFHDNYICNSHCSRLTVRVTPLMRDLLLDTIRKYRKAEPPPYLHESRQVSCTLSKTAELKPLRPNLPHKSRHQLSAGQYNSGESRALPEAAQLLQPTGHALPSIMQHAHRQREALPHSHPSSVLVSQAAVFQPLWTPHQPVHSTSHWAVEIA